MWIVPAFSAEPAPPSGGESDFRHRLLVNLTLASPPREHHRTVSVKAAGVETPVAAAWIFTVPALADVV